MEAVYSNPELSLAVSHQPPDRSLVDTVLETQSGWCLLWDDLVQPSYEKDEETMAESIVFTEYPVLPLHFPIFPEASQGSCESFWPVNYTWLVNPKPKQLRNGVLSPSLSSLSMVTLQATCFNSMAIRWKKFCPPSLEQEMKLDHVKLLMLRVYLSLQHSLA